MKRQWTPEELVEHFTLLPDERALLANKTGHNRLGFAILLKFFQVEARFPVSKQEIPKQIVSYMAVQVEVSSKQYREYEWQGSTFAYHRAQVRTFFEFREATVQDAQDLTEWLGQKILAFERQEVHLQEAVYQHLRSLKIEPPTKERVERLIRSAVHTAEEAFCSNTVKQLSTTALRLGTAETDVILKRFNRSIPQHPTYRALAELGKAVKTIFLCQYLHSEELRREINEGLNVVEQWNGANSFIFYGKNSEFATNRLEEQEVSALSLHLLQICLVYINTLMIQRVLSEKSWLNRMQPDDWRALTPLIWGHVNPYGIFRLDMNERLLIDSFRSEAAE